MRLLVTGGAGYIGSHFCAAAAAAGHEPVAFDNLSTGHRDAVRFGAFAKGDLRDRLSLKSAFAQHRPEAVVHFAAKALVGESMERPSLYYDNNTAGTANLLAAMEEAGVTRLVFSSSCATYGLAKRKTISERHPQSPVNPYGRSKLQGEEMILDQHRLKGWKVAVLRYFNVVGRDAAAKLSERHEPETHVIPNILRALEAGRDFTVHGDDYPTPDGTCVRDYVDVTDLAQVHLAALREIETRGLLVSNAGRGRGLSVLEVFAAFELVFGSAPRRKVGPRRPGDPPSLVADAKFFRSWYPAPMRTLEDSLRSLKP